jgi:hypothetical protein
VTCRFCKKDLSNGPISIVALPEDYDDRNASAVGCVACAVREGYLCTEHDQPHVGFGRNGHACLRCIDAQLRVQSPRAKDLIVRLREGLEKDQYDDLLEAGEIAASITCESVQNCILRFILCVAIPSNRTCGDVVTEIINEQDVSIILPSPI